MRLIIKIGISLLVLFTSCIIFFFLCLFDIVKPSDKGTFKSHFGKIPNSVKNLEVKGHAALAGSNIKISFDIAPEDLKKLIEENKDFLVLEDFWKENPQKLSPGIIDEIKEKAKQKGIVPDAIYVKRDSRNLVYRIMVVNHEKNRVYYVYFKT